MGESKQELSTINMLYFLKKIVMLHPFLSITARATTALFFCPQGGLCGEVGLYSNIIFKKMHLSFVMFFTAFCCLFTSVNETAI